MFNGILSEVAVGTMDLPLIEFSHLSLGSALST